MKRFTKSILVISISLAVLATAGITYASTRPHYVAPVVQTTQTNQTPPTAGELLKLVNEERTKNGVAPLVEDSRLDQSAQRKADDEVRYNYFGHISPNDGKHGYEYINDVGIYCKSDSENLRQNGTDNSSLAVFNGWMSSKPHRDAMLSKDYNLTGIGINGNEIVEHFCQQ